MKIRGSKRWGGWGRGVAGVLGFWMGAGMLPAWGMVDANGNGMSDLWEKVYFQQRLFPADPIDMYGPGADPDHDGWDNRTEAAAGTNPFSAAEPWGKTVVRVEPRGERGKFTASWSTFPGKVYQLEASYDIRGWVPVGGLVLGTMSDVVQRLEIDVQKPDGTIPDRVFWRLKVEDRDVDRDGMTDYEEYLIGTDPFVSQVGESFPMDGEEVQLTTDPGTLSFQRLSATRSAWAQNGYTAPRVYVMGDSMIGLARPMAETSLIGKFGFAGNLFTQGTMSGGAAMEYDACEKWITGQTYRVPEGGEVVFDNYGLNNLEANTLKLYYIQQPGGGTFRVETSMNGGAWAVEPSASLVNSDGELAGKVLTFTKTAYKGIWRLRVVGIGGASNLISAGIYHTGPTGALLAFDFNGSTSINNIDRASQTPRAITDPIFADLRLNLVIHSNLDGAEINAGHLTKLLENIRDGVRSGGAPDYSSVVIGPPVGPNEEADRRNAAQALVQRAIADEMGYVFIDNRKWMGSPSKAVANGLMREGDVHPTVAANRQTWAQVVGEVLEGTESSHPYTSEVRFPRGARLREPAASAGGSTFLPGLELLGSLRIANYPGASQQAYLMIENLDGASASWDAARIDFRADTLRLGFNSFSHGLRVKNRFGQYELFMEDGTNVGNTHLGTAAAPWGHVYLERELTPAGTTGSRTIHRASGTVNFAPGMASLEVINSKVTADSLVFPVVMTEDTDMKSVVVVPAAGSFKMVANLPPKKEVKVGFMVVK